VYSKTTCASSDAPLDNSEQLLNIENPNVYCTRNGSASHLPISCETCGETFPGLEELKTHANKLYFDGIGSLSHYPFHCAIEGCTSKAAPKQINAHFNVNHPYIKYRCAECSIGCNSLYELDRHGEEMMHAAYLCRYPECGSESTRSGDLRRHQLIHKENVPRFPCPHCRK